MTFKKLIEEELAVQPLQALKKQYATLDAQIRQNPTLAQLWGKQTAEMATSIQSLEAYLAQQEKVKQEQAEAQKLQSNTAATNPGIRKTLSASNKPIQQPAAQTAAPTQQPVQKV